MQVQMAGVAHGFGLGKVDADPNSPLLIRYLLSFDQVADRNALVFDFRALPYITGVHPPQVCKAGQDAACKAALAAVDARLALLAPEVVLGQEFLPQCCADVLPREGLVYWSFPVGIKVRLQTDGCESLHPQVIAVMLVPGIELCPAASRPGR